jgi:hypothetical protein
MKRISEGLNFQSFPTPYFEEIELKDNTNYAKIYARLIELGVLTPEQGLKAIDTNILPDPELMEKSQQEYKAQRDKGLYEPLVGGAKDATDAAGRPAGTKSPSKTISPMGGKASSGEIKYSIGQVTKNLLKMQELEGKVVEELKKIHKIKKLNKTQESVASQITHLIVINEEPEKWFESVATYSESPIDKNPERVGRVVELAAQHQLEDFMAALLLISKSQETDA